VSAWHSIATTSIRSPIIPLLKNVKRGKKEGLGSPHLCTKKEKPHLGFIPTFAPKKEIIDE